MHIKFYLMKNALSFFNTSLGNVQSIQFLLTALLLLFKRTSLENYENDHQLR